MRVCRVAIQRVSLDRRKDAHVSRLKRTMVAGRPSNTSVEHPTSVGAPSEQEQQQHQKPTNISDGNTGHLQGGGNAAGVAAPLASTITATASTTASGSGNDNGGAVTHNNTNTTTRPGGVSFVSASLYVGDLDSSVTETDLYELFNSIGPVASIRVCRDSTSRASLGYAYVNYHSTNDAELALETLNFTPVKGNRPCRIMWCNRDPSLRKGGAGNVFVKDLDKNVDNRVLYDTFSMFGPILSCKVAVDSQGRSKGYGFVHFETESAATEAVARVNGVTIGSKRVQVCQFLRKNERELPDSVISEGSNVEPGTNASPGGATTVNSGLFTNLYVRNFPSEWSEDTLKEIFSTFGEITSVALRQDPKNRPFGFVNFAEPSCAVKAVEVLHGGKVEGNRVVQPEARQTATTTVTPSPEDNNTGNKATDEQEGAADEAKPEERQEDEEKFYCQRAQTKAERLQMLRNALLQQQQQQQHSTAVGTAGGTTLTAADRNPPAKSPNGPSGVAAPTVINAAGTNLYVKNFPETYSDEDLKKLFEPYGQIVSAKVMREQGTETSKGFGFVSFGNVNDGAKAITALHLTKLQNGKPLYVAVAEKKANRQHRMANRYRFTAPSSVAALCDNIHHPNSQRGGPAQGAAMFAPPPFIYHHQPPGAAGSHHSGPPPHMGVWNPWLPPQHAGAYLHAAYHPSPAGQQQHHHNHHHNQNRAWTTAGGSNRRDNNSNSGNVHSTGSSNSGLQHSSGGVGQPKTADSAAGTTKQVAARPQASEPVVEPATAGASGPSGSVPMKRMLGESLYRIIYKTQPQLAGKITGMMLEMEDEDLISLINDQEKLMEKVEEAVLVLKSSAAASVAAQQQQRPSVSATTVE